jgi:hypothetical protein
MIIRRENQATWIETFICATSLTANHTWTALVMNPGFCGQKQQLKETHLTGDFSSIAKNYFEYMIEVKFCSINYNKTIPYT